MTSTAALLEIRWLTSLQDMDAFAKSWRKLDAESEATYVWFQSYEWCRHWIENHGHDRTPRILVLMEANEPVAVLPLQLKRTRFGIKTLEILGSPHSQYSNVLTRKGYLSAREVKTMRDALAAHASTDAVVFNLVPDGSALQHLLEHAKALPSLANESAQFEFATLNGQSFGLSQHKDKQRESRRCMRILEKVGPVTLDVLRPGMADYRTMIEKCMAMKAEWLGETAKMGDSVMYEGHARFLASMAQSTHATDGPYVWVMKAGDQPVAIEIGYLQRGHYYAYMGGFDWSHRKASPGKLQMGMTLDALAALGAKEYDLLANPTDYKLVYSTQQRALSGHIVNLTHRGSLYTSLWTRFLRPTLRHSFYALPPSIRQVLMAVRKVPIYVGV